MDSDLPDTPIILYIENQIMEKQIFRPKSNWLMFFITYILGFGMLSIGIMALTDSEEFAFKILLGIFFLALSVFLLVYMAFVQIKLRYEIDGENLFIKGSLFLDKTIPVASIKKVKKIFSILNSPATTSYHRLEIFYNSFDSYMISPADESGFLNALQAINPEIEVVLDKK